MCLYYTLYLYNIDIETREEKEDIKTNGDIDSCVFRLLMWTMDCDEEVLSNLIIFIRNLFIEGESASRTEGGGRSDIRSMMAWIDKRHKSERVCFVM